MNSLPETSVHPGREVESSGPPVSATGFPPLHAGARAAADPVSTVYHPEGGAGRNTPVVYTTLKYQLIIVCYGPASETNARRIRHMLFLDGTGFPRRILRNAGIFPVPDPPQPSLLHEEEGSLWRKRADLTISLRVRDEQRAQARNSINSPPAIVIH